MGDGLFTSFESPNKRRFMFDRTGQLKDSMKNRGNGFGSKSKLWQSQEIRAMGAKHLSDRQRLSIPDALLQARNPLPALLRESRRWLSY